MAGLRKNLGFVQGLALYLAAVLGTGILVIPLLAWREGGAASLIAWFLLGVLGLSLGWTFAAAGAEYPDAGGIQTLIKRIFGKASGTISRWLIFFSVPAGGAAAAHIYADHLVAAFQLQVAYVPWIAASSWILVGGANYFGIRVSVNAQLVLSGLLVFLLSVVVVFGLPSIDFRNFVPFAPAGVKGVGKAAVLIFWSFLGWEAIAHLAEEFKNPRRDMIRAAVVAAIIVGFFYIAVSFVLIGVGVMTSGVADRAPLVTLAETMAGSKGRIFSGVLASIICLGTMNVYMTGLSRLGYAMGRDGDLPKWIGKLSEASGTPRRSILCLVFMNTSAITIQAAADIPLRNFFLIPNVAFLLLYIFGCLAIARLLSDRSLVVVAAYFSALVCAIMLPFATEVLFYPALIVICACAYMVGVRKIKRFAFRANR